MDDASLYGDYMNEGDFSKNNLNILENCLKNGSFEKALSFITEEAKTWFATSSWDSVPIICKFLNEENQIKNPKLIECCRTILKEEAKVCGAEETLFIFLDQLQTENNDVLFLSLLEPIDIVLNNHKKRLFSLKTFLTTMKESLTALNYDDVERVMNIFIKVEEFYVRYIKEVTAVDIMEIDDPDTLSDIEYERQILSCFLMQLLALLAPVEPRQLIENIIHHLEQLLPSMGVPFQYFMDHHIGTKRRTNVKRKYRHYLYDVPVSGFQMLYYMIFHHQVGIKTFPAVYSPEYIFNVGIGLSFSLLASEDEKDKYKGLLLLGGILKQCSTESIPHYHLASSLHDQIFKCISYVMIYNTSETVRKFATSLLKQYLYVWDPKGRYLYIQNAVRISAHSGITGYLITQIKEIALKYINTKNYFITNLPQLLTSVCKLDQGKETLLFDYSDSIISTLNLIRFLVMKDPKPGDLGTGIWTVEAYLKENYTDILAKALDNSKEYLKGQYNEAECLKANEKAQKRRAEKKEELVVRINDQVIPEPKYEDEIKGILKKSNDLDFIQFQLDMLNEKW